MPSGLIQKLAKQLGVKSAVIEKKWQKIVDALKSKGKLKGDSVFKVANKVLQKQCGQKASNENIAIVFDLEGVDEKKIIDAAVDVNTSLSVLVEHDEKRFFVTFNEKVPIELSESYLGYTPRYSTFDNRFTSVYNLIWQMVDRMRNKMSQAENEKTYCEELENKAWDILKEQCDIDRDDFEEDSDEMQYYRIMYDEDKEGFHVLHSYQPNDALGFFYAMWEYDKKLAMQLIREGLMFSYHRYYKFDEILKN